MTRTDKVWLGTLAWLLAYESWAILHKQETLSQSVWNWSSRSAFLPFGAGVIAGHFWFSAVKAVGKDGV